MDRRALVLLATLGSVLLAGCTGFGERLLAPGMDRDLEAFLEADLPTTFEALVLWQPEGVGDLFETCVRVVGDEASTDGDHPPFVDVDGEPLAMTLTAVQAMARAVHEDEGDGLVPLVPPSVPDKVSILIAPGLGQTPAWGAIFELGGCGSAEG